ncbi:MAG: TonB-dependent receptor [Microscillaceae bacterium]|nr:TonB-dependent receptor [Microscillaceae bacterium]MDW8460761.1 TonB-dependent receptor [Cytophagales bacterium]
MRQKYLFLTLSLFLIFSYSIAQTGSIRGKITDATEKKEPAFGATVTIEGTNIATATDLDGNFLFPKLLPGTYTIKVTYIGYKEKIIEKVVVYAGKVTEVNATIEEDTQMLEGAVVIAQRETFSEISVISEIKMAENVAVGISAEQINRSQDRDASQAIRRVPGVSLIDNRFVIVRGLSQRYNTVLLNDIITPSSEVDTRAFSFDIVPSNIIDRMLVYKSGASEIPGDFAGGVVKIYTRTAPEQNFTNFGIGTGYRVGTTFGNAQTQQSGTLDFLGIDDGKRRIPQAFPDFVSSILSNQERANLAKQFKTNWDLNNTSISPDLRLNFSLGRRFNIGEAVVGNLTAINYSNTQQYFDSDVNLFTSNPNDRDRFTNLDITNKDKVITNNIRLGVLHNWLLRLDKNHTIEFKNLFNQLSFVQTVVRNQKDFRNDVDYLNYSLRFEKRSIYSGQLIGRHNFRDDNLKLNWQLGYAYTNKQEPDWRRVRTNRTLGTEDAFLISFPPSPNIIDVGRFYSNLYEGVISAATNVELNLDKEQKTEEKRAKLRGGFYFERKDRSFRARFFGYKVVGNAGNINSLPISQALSSSNLTGESGFLTMEEGTRPQDRYTADNTLLAGYVGTSIPITSKLGLSTGVRVEYNLQQIQSRRLDRTAVNVSNAIVSPLPSLNLTYDLTDKSLLRLAYSLTINRPEFRELAPFDYYDFNLNAFVIGNSELKNATIQNADIRYEYYPSPGELISIGAFYKYFTNPIETFLLLSVGGATNFGYSFLNAKTAQNFGGEIEFRKAIGGETSSRFLKNLSINANAALIFSQVDLGKRVRVPNTDGGIVEVDVAETQDKNRPMAFQSPYLVNVGLYYNDEESGWQASLLYNVFGQRIFAVGTIDNPTIYEMPRNIIDLALTKRLSNGLEVRFGIQDLLNQPFLLKQDSNIDKKITADDKTFNVFRRGQYFSLGVNYIIGKNTTRMAVN